MTGYTRIVIVTLALSVSGGALCLYSKPVSAEPKNTADFIDQEIASNRACQKIYDINLKESAQRRNQLNRISDGDYAALCRFGRKTGHPGLVRAYTRFTESTTCNRNDPVVSAVIERSMLIAEQNLRAVDRDCARAGL